MDTSGISVAEAGGYEEGCQEFTPDLWGLFTTLDARETSSEGVGWRRAAGILCIGIPPQSHSHP